MRGLKRLVAISAFVLAACGDSPGTAVHATLVSVAAEPAGSHCAAGGQAIEVGVDGNDNGTLDTSEIKSTSYVCNGAVGAVGPSGDTGPTGPAGSGQPVIATAPEPAGSHCAAGGIAVSVGFDSNGNGLLDASEVTGTTYVCNGSLGGKISLVSITVEPAGSNCAAGGIKVQSGVDANGNGTLDSNEISSTKYVCSGAAGCLTDGQSCTAASQCCSSSCTGGSCGLGSCKADGQSCTAASQCCSSSCTGGTCGLGSCKPDGQSCTAASQCCSDNCTGGTCGAAACNPVGYYCNVDGDCCTQTCSGGRCCSGSSCGSADGGETCKQDGQGCAIDSDCCDLDCAGGICGGAAPDGGSCHATGASCSYGLDCCSGACASGLCASCLGEGKACAQTSDCCSAYCVGGACAATCGAAGQACTAGADCCSQSCVSGTCADTSDGGPGQDAGLCAKPTTLHPPKSGVANSIFCPFSEVDGGQDEYCYPGTEHCCETQATSGMPSSCEPIATQCGTGDTDWQCEDPVADCLNATSPVCCAPGASILLGGTGCGNFSQTFTSTICVAAGSCSGIIMCTSDAECPSGKVCTPFGKAGNQVGGCL